MDEPPQGKIEPHLAQMGLTLMGLTLMGLTHLGYSRTNAVSRCSILTSPACCAIVVSSLQSTGGGRRLPSPCTLPPGPWTSTGCLAAPRGGAAVKNEDDRVDWRWGGVREQYSRVWAETHGQILMAELIVGQPTAGQPAIG